MNTFGHTFRVSIFGESHGSFVGITIDGCPAGIALTVDDFKADLLRRKSGRVGTTPRIEADLPEIASGVYNGYTTGAPVTILFRNENTRSTDYEQHASIPRPGHVDFVATQKYGGYSDPRGGGHFSGRITLGIVAAGVIAKKLVVPITINAQLISVGGSTDIEAEIEKAMQEGDSVGGLVECRASSMSVGLGEPFFDSLESLAAHMLFAIPAVKGVEFGSGFAAADMRGSEHNDRIVATSGATATNYAGGINGGISNGNDLLVRIAVKPTSSISKAQETINLKTNKPEKLEVVGRHDSCIALRFPVIAEASVAIVLADLLLRSRALTR